MLVDCWVTSARVVLHQKTCCGNTQPSALGNLPRRQRWDARPRDGVVIAVAMSLVRTDRVGENCRCLMTTQPGQKQSQVTQHGSAAEASQTECKIQKMSGSSCRCCAAMCSPSAVFIVEWRANSMLTVPMSAESYAANAIRNPSRGRWWTSSLGSLASNKTSKCQVNRDRSYGRAVLSKSLVTQWHLSAVTSISVECSSAHPPELDRICNLADCQNRAPRQRFPTAFDVELRRLNFVS